MTIVEFMSLHPFIAILTVIGFFTSAWLVGDALGWLLFNRGMFQYWPSRFVPIEGSELDNLQKKNLYYKMKLQELRGELEEG